MTRIVFLFIIFNFSLLAIDKIAVAAKQVCDTAVGQAGLKKQLSDKDKKRRKICEAEMVKKMNTCLNKGREVLQKEKGKTKKSMIRLLESQRNMATCNLDASIAAVKKYY